MSILLTKDEVKVIQLRHTSKGNVMPQRAVARAQLYKVAEWLSGPCIEHGYYRGEPRVFCPFCRIELRKEAGLGVKEVGGNGL